MNTLVAITLLAISVGTQACDCQVAKSDFIEFAREAPGLVEECIRDGSCEALKLAMEQNQIDSAKVRACLAIEEITISAKEEEAMLAASNSLRVFAAYSKLKLNLISGRIIDKRKE